MNIKDIQIKKYRYLVIAIGMLCIIAFFININIRNNNESKIKYGKKYSESQINKEIDDLIEKYEESIIESINKKDFFIIEPYLMENSKLYDMQKKLVKRLGERNIKEKLITFQVEKIKKVNNKYNVYVYEKIDIDYNGKLEKIKEFDYIYEVTSDNGILKLSDIFSNEEKDQKDEDNIKTETDSKYSNENNYENTGVWEYNPITIDELCDSTTIYLNKKVEVIGVIIYVKERFSTEDILISNGKNVVHIYSYKNKKFYKGDHIVVDGTVIGNTNDYRTNTEGKQIPSIYGEKITVSRSY